MLSNTDTSEFENRIPSAVRRASERADAIAREVGAANVPGADDNTPAPGDDSGQQQQVQPEGDGGTGDDTTTAPVVEPPKTDQPTDNWEQRYRTLQGKYDAEIGQLRQQVGSLQHLLGQLQSAPPTPAVSTPSDTSSAAFTPTKEDVEAFGEDLITASRRWAQAEVRPVVERLERRITELQSGQSNIQQETAQARVMTSLDTDPELSGKWRDINMQPEFLSWLGQVDPFSGQQRMQLLQGAFASGDAVRTGSFFKAFVKEHTAVTNNSAAVDTQTSADAGTQLPLENLAAPGRAAGQGQGGASTEKRTITRKQVTDFYRDCAQGRYANNEAARLRLEADIFAAAAEGRIT
jgi:hypothetical protein